MYSLAAEKYWYAASAFAEIHNVDIDYLCRDGKNRLKKKEPSFRNDDIDYILCHLFVSNERSGVWDFDSLLYELSAMARANNKYAMKLCNDMNLNPYSAEWNPKYSLW